jgi:P-type conjugative transfer protein TrbJ
MKRLTALLSILVAIGWLVFATPAHAIFGVGDVVFDPTMYASQLQQLAQETATVQNLAQQLQYVIKNTTGGWSSNAGLLNNLGDIINQQEGLSYTIQGLSTQFQQYYAGYAVSSLAGIQSPMATGQTTLNTLNGTLVSAQAQAQNFGLEQAALGNLELKNQTAVGNLQAVQVSNELALAQVQQMQMLRQLVMAQTNSQNVVAAQQINAQQQSEMNAMAFFGAPPSSDIASLYNSTGPSPPQYGERSWNASNIP